MQAVSAQAASSRAEQEARQARSGYLASQGLLKLDTQPDLAALLAVEAYQTADTYQARDILLRALLQPKYLEGYLYLPDHEFSAAAFSPDGEILATAGCLLVEGFCNGGSVVLGICTPSAPGELSIMIRPPST
jgi:hypothetical protein